MYFHNCGTLQSLLQFGAENVFSQLRDLTFSASFLSSFTNGAKKLMLLPKLIIEFYVFQTKNNNYNQIITCVYTML